METAQEEYIPMKEVALSVEQCQCPANYVGLSCEECADGFYRAQTGPYGGFCVPCQCNSHSNTCNKVTGMCDVNTFKKIILIIFIKIIFNFNNVKNSDSDIF